MLGNARTCVPLMNCHFFLQDQVVTALALHFFSALDGAPERLYCFLKILE
jgi:hypothetical protein